MNLLPPLFPIAYAQGAPAVGQSPWTSLLLFGGMFLLFYVLLWRPQSKRAKEHRELVSGISKGDEVMTSGGGHKQHYRIVDFKRSKLDVPAVVERIEYDPNRSAHLALLKYVDGERRYIIAPNKIKIGDSVISANQTEMNPGNSMCCSTRVEKIL